MRERLRPFRRRTMARRPGEEGGFRLSPRDRRLLGWIAAAAVLVGIAIAVGVLGGNGDGAPVGATASTSPSAAAAGGQIAFGTALDAATGEVAPDTRVARFAGGDTFAYSISPQGPLPGTVYVEVERIGGGPVEVVQSAAEEGMQPVPEGSPAVAFTVAASRLLEVFGPGEYRMRIFADPTAAPLAEGTFELVADAPSGSAAPSASGP